MIDRLTNHEIDLALEELVPLLGIREAVDTYNLMILLQNKDVSGAISGVTGILGLPVKIKLSFVSATYRPNRSGSTDGFQTTSLTHTDWRGRGSESITAQVQIPPGLPMFGTPALKDYPVQVRVSENCYENPETFLAIMAHELSHVLLASIRYVKKDNELHTDLVPILSGLGATVRRGRRVKKNTYNGNQTITHTTTYGYLPDVQFTYACDCVNKMLDRYRREKNDLLKQVHLIHNQIENVVQDLAVFRKYYAYLDDHPVTAMKEKHARRIVQLHTHDFGHEWGDAIASLDKSRKEVESFANNLDHYTAKGLERLKKYTRDLESAFEKLDALEKEIGSDTRVLGSYIGFFGKLKFYFTRDSR